MFRRLLAVSLVSGLALLSAGRPVSAQSLLPPSEEDGFAYADGYVQDGQEYVVDEDGYVVNDSLDDFVDDGMVLGDGTITEGGMYVEDGSYFGDGPYAMDPYGHGHGGCSTCDSGCSSCDSGCGSCGGAACGCGIHVRTPKLKCYFRMEALGLERDDPRERWIAENTLTGDVFTNDVDDFDMEAGVRLTAGLHLGCKRIEVSYFGIYDLESAAITVEDTGNWDAIDPFAALPLDEAFFDADQYAYSYDTELHSAELNLRCSCGSSCSSCSSCCSGGAGLSWFLGTRFMYLGEDFNVTSFDELPVNEASDVGTYDASVENYLIGGQIGADYEHMCCGCLGVHLSGKAGVFANIINRSLALNNAVDGELLTFNDDTTEVAGVFEASGVVSYYYWDCLRIFGGYQTMWIEGVGLAAEQFDETTIDHDGGIFLHGPVAGFELRK